MSLIKEALKKAQQDVAAIEKRTGKKNTPIEINLALGKGRVRKLNEKEQRKENLRRVIEEAERELDEIARELKEIELEEEAENMTPEELEALREEISSLEEEYRRVANEADQKNEELNRLYNEDTKGGKVGKQISKLEKERSDLNTRYFELSNRLFALDHKRRLAVEISDRRRREQEESRRHQEIKEDKKANPFKYFVLERMSDQAFLVIFGKDRNQATLADLNRFEIGNKLNQWSRSRIWKDRPSVTDFTSNGFFLELQNPQDLKFKEGGEEKIASGSERAKYILVSPEWKNLEEITGYENALKAMEGRAREYQDKLLEEFNNQNK